MKRAGLLVVLLFSLRDAAADEIMFERHVRPIFKANCFHCHGEESELEGKLDLRLVRTMMAGGDSGAAITPGNAAESLLVEKIASGDMPPGKKKLTADQLAVIRRWIEQGAKTSRPEPAAVSESEITAEERSFWSFQPVRRAPVPQVKNSALVSTPIDAFLLQRLEAEQLSYSPPADLVTLCRRVYFDLIGLPPTPEQVTEFVQQCAASSREGESGRAGEGAKAYEALVDKLLNSPHYGERWGRHWLDIAGYADSDGYSDQDYERPYAYKYRDYVIRAFNDDKPFDVFIQEQLAGDELVPQPYSNLSAQDIDRLVATGFLRMGPDGTADKMVDPKLARNEVMAETIKIVSTSLLGLSVGCAQCHNHRYDPISHVDYHRIRAMFEPAYDWQAWRLPQERLVSLWDDEARRQAAAVDMELAKLAEARDVEMRRQLAPLLEKEIAALPANVREEVGAQVREAILHNPKNKTDVQSALLRKYPKLKVTDATLRRSDPTRFQQELKAYEADVAKIKVNRPADDYAHALTEIPGHLPTTYLFKRGDFNQRGEVVAPGELAVLTHDDRQPVPTKDPQLSTSGRRLAYAKHLTDGRHPLTARVWVNRVWHHHFGRGIVATPSEFGAQGERPSHPELLDWLADEFVQGQWQVKRLHKLILMSTAFRQSARRTPQLDTIDEENRLLGRMNVRRLDAETIRDSVLAVSGKLNDTMFGAPLPVAPNDVGQVVIGVSAGGRDGRVNGLKGNEGNRRSVYVQARRTLPLAMLEAFDAPTMVPNCEIRNNSTVTPQSLLLMNNDFVVEQSEMFAERVARESDNSPESQVRRAWELALGREPTDKQVARAVAFLEEQKQHFLERLADKSVKPVTDKPARFANFPARQALANFCQFLISNNAFLYVD